MSVQESAISILGHEHSIIGVVIVAMEREAERIRTTGTVDTARVHKIVEFTRGFTDACHHAKEEEVLFPRLLERNPTASSPVDVMMREHEAGRARITAIAENLEAVEHGDDQATGSLCENLQSYAALLTAHIAKENNVLFPLANRSLSADDQQWLAEEFERVEEEEIGLGEHERFHKLAEELGEQSG